MNKRQKEVLEGQMYGEEAVLHDLELQYKKALNDINRKIRILESDELTQSRIYRLEYQKALKAQVEAILEKLHSDNYSTIKQFLSDSYTDGFLGTMYDLHGQGVPLVFPVDPKEAVRAIMTESKLSLDLYTTLGVDIAKLTRTVSSEITRGIASELAYTDIARNISNAAKAPFSRAKTIVQTEAHRIQQAATLDAQRKAKSRGADVVKQWNSTLDGETRPTHRELDGQIREVEEPFEANGEKAMYPGNFGDPAEDCNCRCVSLTRAKWALGEDELNILKARAEFFGLDKTANFNDFKKKYIKAAESLEKSSKNDIMKVKNSDLPNGLPLKGVANSIVDKTDDDGTTLQRRIYGADGMATTDFDTSDHGQPKVHPTGAHKHTFDHSKKTPRGKPLALTSEELAENEDIIQKGVNYRDED